MPVIYPLFAHSWDERDPRGGIRTAGLGGETPGDSRQPVIRQLVKWCFDGLSV